MYCNHFSSFIFPARVPDRSKFANFESGFVIGLDVATTLIPVSIQMCVSGVMLDAMCRFTVNNLRLMF